MKQKAILVLFAVMILSLTLGVATAQPSVDVTPKVVMPGETITIIGTGAVSSNIIIEVSNTRSVIETFNITTDSAGKYEIEYRIPDNSPIDIYIVNASANDESTETSFMVSHMTQQQVSETVRNMVIEARKQAETALIEVRKQGHVVPQEIWNKYHQGLTELETAANYIQSQNFVSAQNSLQNAMNLFKEVVE